uniref:MADF domain-containing protein n=1 Tax=Glossina pallidipes TaxID=7398 RepID=A0A1B0A629_GLOPL
MMEEQLINAVYKRQEVHNKRFPGFRKAAIEKAWIGIAKKVGVCNGFKCNLFGNLLNYQIDQQPSK